MDPNEPKWNCPTCGVAVLSQFCPACGERPLHARELTLGGLAELAMEACVNLDGKVVRSFRKLTFSPGALTVAYLQGQRMPYTQPLQLFLLANVLFFAIQWLTGLPIFSTPLDKHFNNQIWSVAARKMVADHLRTANTTLAQYSPVFNQAVALNAKSFTFLMVIPFALLPPVLFRKSRQPYVIHIVFSVHFYAFLLILFSLSSIVAGIEARFGGRGLESAAMDNTVTIAWLVLAAIYLYIGSGIVCGGSRAVRALKVLPMICAVGSIVLGYRFGMFWVTLHAV